MNAIELVTVVFCVMCAVAMGLGVVIDWLLALV